MDIVPIPGTKQQKYLEENVQSANIHLSNDETNILDKALASEIVAGPRYNESLFKFIDR